MEKYYLNDHEGALLDLSRAIEINPNIAPAYYFRAVILLNSDRTAACADLNKAANLGLIAAYELIQKNCK